MIKRRFSFYQVIVFLAAAIVFAIIGSSLPNTINYLNQLKEGSYYGYVASYITASILFWVFTRKLDFCVKRESYFVKFYETLNKKKRVNK